MVYIGRFGLCLAWMRFDLDENQFGRAWTKTIGLLEASLVRCGLDNEWVS